MSKGNPNNVLDDFNLDEYVEGPAAIVKAIRGGEVDAFVVCEADCDRVYTLGNGEPPYRKIIEEMKEGAALLNHDGEVLYCNSYLSQLVGIPAGELFLAPVSEWVKPESRAALKDCLEKGKCDHVNLELQIQSKNGATTPVMFTASPIPVDGTDVICAIVTDLSPQLRTESERAARNEAERANRLKDEYLATVSHELRNPLNVIVNWATLLRTKKLNAGAVAQGLEAIERSARVQAKIIDDLLDMNRISSGKLRLEKEAFDLSTAAQAALETIVAAADEKKIDVRADMQSVIVSGDPGRLQQVVSNLLSNAIKFTPEGGTIKLHVSQVDGKAHLCVKDSGEGIGADFLPFIFERFRQGDGALTRRRGGLGLGLAIVKQLVELHGGTVTGKSDGEGKGSRFEISLPLATEADLAQEKGYSCLLDPELDHDLTGLKIVVVDDDPDGCEVVRRFLLECGAEVEVARSAKEALKIISHTRPDVLVSDIGMPHEDGYDLITKVRAIKLEGNKRMAAIALTALARTEDRDRALSAGYDRHIAKPVEPVALALLIKQLHSQRQAER